MLVEDERFRISLDTDDNWSFKLTRSDLLRKLKKSCIEKSYNWPYSLKVGKVMKYKNMFGKNIFVRREYSITQEHRRIKFRQEIPYMSDEKIEATRSKHNLYTIEELGID